MNLYTATGLAEAAGVSYRQIDHWTRSGALDPLTVKGLPTKGTGNGRIYGEDALRKARGLALLVGLDSEKAGREVARALAMGRADLGHGFSLHYDQRPTP